MSQLKKLQAAIVGIFVFCVSSLVWAAQPLREVFVADVNVPITCDGFDLIVAMHIDTKGTLFIDNEGNPLVYQPQNTATVEIYRNDGVGDVLTGMRREMQRWDEITGEGVANGGFIRVTVPGYGAIFFDVGHTVFNADGTIAFVSGKHEVLLEETDALCAYFESF